jgi:hypothetical protein
MVRNGGVSELWMVLQKTDRINRKYQVLRARCSYQLTGGSLTSTEFPQRAH